jgi:hypothetical protein
MERRFDRRSLAASVAVLSGCLLIVTLLMAARSAGAIAGVDPGPGHDAASAGGPRAPSAVNRVLLPKSTAAYNGVITPTTKLYAPWFLGGTSALRVYNAGAGLANVRATFTTQGDVRSVEIPLAQGAVGEIALRGMLTGTVFSAIVTSTQPIVAVVNDFGPAGKQASSYAAMPASLGQTHLALPNVIYQSTNGWDSKPVVHNVSATTTSVTIAYSLTIEPPTTTHWVDNSIQDLGPDEARIIDPGQAGLPENFTGIATIRTEQPVVAAVYNAATEIGELYPREVFVYRVPLPAGESGGRSLYFPLLFRSFENWKNAWIQLMNARSTASNFELRVDEVPSSESLDVWWADFWGQEAQAADWYGAGRVADAQSLYSLIWLRGDFQGDSYAVYSAPSVGAKTWYLPYTDRLLNLTTYVAVQNFNAGSSAQITLTYHNMTGTLTSVPMGNVAPFDTALYASDSGFIGGVVVEASEPVAAVAVIAGSLILDEETFLPVVTKNSGF